MIWRCIVAFLQKNRKKFLKKCNFPIDKTEKVVYNRSCKRCEFTVIVSPPAHLYEVSLYEGVIRSARSIAFTKIPGGERGYL